MRLTVRESSESARGAIDLAGALLLACALGALMLAIPHGNQWGWGSSRTLVLLAAAALLAGTFWVRERTATAPLLHPRVLATRSVWSANVAMLALGFSLLISLTLVPLIAGYPKLTGYGLGLSATQIGLVLAPSGFATIAGGLLGGWLLSRTSAPTRFPGLPAARGFTDAFTMAAIATFITIADAALAPSRAADPATTTSKPIAPASEYARARRTTTRLKTIRHDRDAR